MSATLTRHEIAERLAELRPQATPSMCDRVARCAARSRRAEDDLLTAAVAELDRRMADRYPLLPYRDPTANTAVARLTRAGW